MLVDGVDGEVDDVDVEVIVVSSTFVVLSVVDVDVIFPLVDVDVEDSLLTVGGDTVVDVTWLCPSPFRILLIVFNSGYLVCVQIPRKSSVSIDQIIAPPSWWSTANFVLSPILSESS